MARNYASCRRANKKMSYTRTFYSERAIKAEIEMTVSVSSGRKGLRCRITLSIYVEISPTIILADDEKKMK